MEVHDVRQFSHSNHTQQALFLKQFMDDEEFEEAPRPFIRRLSKATQKEMMDCQTIVSLEHHSHSHDDNSPNMFDRMPIPEHPQQQKSLIAAKRIVRSFTRVYFFQTEQFRDYYKGDFQQGCTIGDFLKEAVQDYCQFFLQFRAEITSVRTFELKLADLQNQHDPVVQQLDPDDELDSYFGSTLCLVRRGNRQSNLKLIQQKLKDSSEVFQVSIPFQNGNRMFEVERSRSFGALAEKIFKACDIIDSPSDYLLVEYNKLLVYNKATPIEQINERDFELLHIKKQHYTDESVKIDDSMERRRLEPEKPMLAPCLLAQLHPNEPLRQIFTTEVQTHFYEGKMTLSIENCVFVERYSKCLLSQLLEFVCQQEYQKRYPLTTLMSAYADQQDLVLIFLVRDRHVIRRYRIPQHKRVLYLSEILRLCRVYRKSLTLPKNIS